MEFVESKNGKKILVLDKFNHYLTENRWGCYIKYYSASV